LLAALALSAGATTIGRATGPVPPRASAVELADEDEVGTSGTDERVPNSHRPAVPASFQRESYRPGAVARLALFAAAGGLSIQVFHTGTESTRIRAYDEMRGTAVTKPRWIGAVSSGRVIRVPVGNWPGGLYYARLTAAHGRIGYAPFVLRPSRLGQHRVAVVLPTFTWQAYNFSDDDGDGVPNTWYASRSVKSVKLFRPFENRGVPPHYKYYDQPFLCWLIANGWKVDYLADSDLDAAGSGKGLARNYNLLVFSGHHEYVTTREFRTVRAFRDHGGNLMFLSANNFFWRVDRRGDRIFRIRKFRELGMPEASVIGVQYIANDDGSHRGPWIVRNTKAAPWVFDGTGVGRGSHLSSAGIEIDKTAATSPRGLHVLAEIPNLLGRGLTGQMTYYETKSGAKVFAAGAFSLAGSVRQPVVSRMMKNLFDRLSQA
jgi:hypothetical protein